MKRINMAIMGAGNIAWHMAEAIGGLQEQVCAYAVASRSLDKAEAEFSVPLSHKQRMYDPALAGGALLDLGMYCLTFASMYFGDAVTDVTSHVEKLDTGVDATDDIYYTYADGKKAYLRTSMMTGPVNRGEIRGTHGSIQVDTLNNFSAIRVYDAEGNLRQEPEIPAQINGYEYEVLACVRAMEAGALECQEMPHSETIEIMEQMDRLRRDWGVAYPFEKAEG